MSDRVKISVIIPVYNLENYIGRCINSLIDQTEKHFEVIIINDGSKDNSIDIIKNKTKEDPRFKLINQDNKGVSIARNKGLEVAKGEYITFIDGDDFVVKDMLYKMYNFAYNNNLCILGSNIYGYGNYSYQYENLLHADEYINLILEGRIPRTACGLLISNTLITINNLRFHEEIKYGEDMLFVLNALTLAKNKKIGFINECFYVVENRALSASRKIDPEHFERALLIATKLNELISKDLINLSMYRYFMHNINRSINNIIKSKINLRDKLTRVYKIKRSNHTRNVTKYITRNENINNNKLKAYLIEYMHPIIIIFIWSITLYKPKLGHRFCHDIFVRKRKCKDINSCE